MKLGSKCEFTLQGKTEYYDSHPWAKTHYNEVYLVEILEDRYYFLETLSTARDLQYLIVNKDKLSTWIKLISEPHIIKVDAVEILNDPTHVQMLESKGRQKLEIVSKLTEDFYEMEIK